MRLLLDTQLPAAKRAEMGEAAAQAALADVAASFQRVAVRRNSSGARTSEEAGLEASTVQATHSHRLPPLL